MVSLCGKYLCLFIEQILSTYKITKQFQRDLHVMVITAQEEKQKHQHKKFSLWHEWGNDNDEQWFKN